MNKFTPGPWRWEMNRKSKSLHLSGGVPQYDLTVMSFDRWGMGDATISLRDTAHDGMNIMHKLHERPDWIASFPNRDHHADWCANVIHPDAQLIAAAPDLLKQQIKAYYVLADIVNQWPDRHTKDGQQLLCDMRDSIANALGINAESVQAGGAA